MRTYRSNEGKTLMKAMPYCSLVIQDSRRQEYLIFDGDDEAASSLKDL